jgi:hypothetical protein
MKHDEDKIKRLRATHEAADLWLEVLCKGIGHVLIDGVALHDMAGLGLSLDKFNQEMSAAIEASKAAWDAYQPHRTRLVHHRRKSQ